MALHSIAELIVRDDAGFACAKSKLVPDGVVHLRPFNIGPTSDLVFDEVYKVPRSEVPVDKCALLEGDILFNNTNSVELVGKTALVRNNLEYGFSNHLTRIRVDRDKVEPGYFAYWLQKLYAAGYFRSHSTQWVSQAAFRVADLRKLTISLPSLSEQRRIVDILDRAASIQKLRKQAQAKAQEIIPALFVDMFGDPATNPKGWHVTTIKALLKSADYGSSAKAAADGPGLPMLRMGNVTVNGNLNLENLKYVELAAAERERYLLDAGDILFNRTNSKELVGKTGLWDGRYEAVHASYFIRLRLDRNQMLPEVLWAFMNLPSTKKRLFAMARGAIGQSNINMRELGAINVFVPELDAQRRFVRALDCLAGMRTLADAAHQCSNAASKALLAKALSQGS